MHYTKGSRHLSLWAIHYFQSSCPKYELTLSCCPTEPTNFEGGGFFVFKILYAQKEEQQLVFKSELPI